MFKVEIGLAALADIEQTYFWLKGQPDASRADVWFTGISEAILSLETMPRRCSFAPEARTLGREIRQLLFGKASTTYRSRSVPRRNYSNFPKKITGRWSPRFSSARQIS